MKTLSIFNAKNKLSSVVHDAEAGEPTIVTRNGKEVAAVIPIEEFRKTRPKQPSFVEFLLNSPLRGSGLKIRRSDDTGREPPDFS